VIAGAGPHALALAARLLCKRPSWRRRLRVVDPAGAWLSRWQRQMGQYEIPWLRSPSPHHPHPNPHALRRFALERQRAWQLEGPYGLPHTDLFADFCSSVVEEFGLAASLANGHLTQLRLPPSGSGPLTLSFADGTEQQARRLVIATGAGAPRLPAWVAPCAGRHPREALQHSSTIDLRALPSLHGQRIAIVGGGLTAAHLVLGALRLGARVVLLCRRTLRERPFDADPGWLGPKYLKGFEAEPSMARRRQLVLEARDGGSIPPETAHRLRQAARHGNNLTIFEGFLVQKAQWVDGGWILLGPEDTHLSADRLWLATGQRLGVSHCPLMRQLQQQRPAPLEGDWPLLGPDLSWPGTSVSVMGGLAALQLGPAARNLYGGRLAAQRITRAWIKG